ncbi:MAG: IgGFc-binding protein [Myxococcota bacterium]|nr:IgGFc-binding protein [Myxococcota bacterium]
MPRRLQVSRAAVPAMCAAAAAWSWACDAAPGYVGGYDARDGDAGECREGERRCASEAVLQTCVGGRWVPGTSCAESGDICVEGLGCVSCAPGRQRCEEDDALRCGPDGETWEVVDTCDTAAGEACDPTIGVCIDLCARAAAERSNIGCEYWAVDLDNWEQREMGLPNDCAACAQFAVVVANQGDFYSAEVVVEVDEARPGDPHALREIDRTELLPGDLRVFNLPRWDVDGDNPPWQDTDPQTTLSRRVYRIRSTTPIVAYQFNPIDQSFSNGASLLLPTTALDTEYYAVTRYPSNPIASPLVIPYANRAYVTIVAVADGTTVRVTPTYDIFAGVGQGDAILPVPAIAEGTTAEFRLDAFDVLNLETREMRSILDDVPDLTGTVVRSDLPVVVFSGVDCTNVGDHTLPDGSAGHCCCEHIESQIPPTSAMGTRFVVPRSPVRSGDGYLEYDYYRVLAVRDGTRVTTNLTEPGLGSFTLDAGEWFEFSTTTGFILTCDPYPVHVAQFLTAQAQVYHGRSTAGGDPEMILVPPVEQRRNAYVFTTGVGFSENWAVVSMPEGASATLDGADVASTCTAAYTDGELDGLTYRAYHCPIADGVHQVLATGVDPVGVIVYGYFEAGSYGYPAGSELRRIFFG